MSTLKRKFVKVTPKNMNNNVEVQSKISAGSSSTVRHAIISKKYEDSIQILVADMNQAIINRYCNNDSAAFTHCISSDFESRKHMSQGVAVVFKESSGTPLETDYVNERLTYQKTIEGAGVYSLVTKEKYY